MTTIQMAVLVLVPVAAVLFCKPVFRRALALQPRDNPDIITEPAGQLPCSE